MKKIEAIVRPEKLESIKNALLDAEIDGLTIYEVNGCGNQYGFKTKIRGNEVMMNTLPKLYIMIVVPDQRADEIVNIIIKTARTNEIGDGKIFISDVGECVRIRTGERGIEAV